ncbi:MAG TPA: phosphohydrolase, partial [Candidatus Egerieenecus merdigallinarum]|nr:phosphohydrolase [Candidatus Egerieenecus merdigallinarum]
MNYTEMLDLITEKMMYFNQNDPKRIQHLIKVHRFA